ncbi:trehalose-phosphatase [Pseudoxanthomonas sacheonensis]|uniref:trehalose-phosphatase n=1 Tax=Pseudoxanthomonas sacheonensis TaxID=443615 RepID=UPI0013D31D9F|nr:trehalose-phosphatase [Pseudoxanthomonas sacheonensis]KAF1706007.1 trehalose-phosphatase [Pseudoxanthomonas sacheonensis]
MKNSGSPASLHRSAQIHYMRIFNMDAMDNDDESRIPPSINRNWALFLDVDGTLAPHVERPDGVVLDDALRRLLTGLSGYLGGALALVSGRSIASLDALLHPLRLVSLAGLHGIQRRTEAGDYRAAQWDDDALADHAKYANELAAHFPGASVEHNGPCLYLHWRSAPEAAPALTGFAEDLESALPSYRLHRGLHGIEIRPAGVDKGEAIRHFMSSPPFAGRRAAFAGDDPADEPGFAAVNEMRGISVLVGAPRATSARFGLPDVDAVLAWLAKREARLVEELA